MAVNFPSNPTNGQTITVSGITYAYDSTQGVWSDSPQGLTQAIDALTDVDTSTTAPTNGQILQWNSTDSEWQPADSSAGVTVYATIDDLPLTGVAEGSMALVDSTDKLYIFSDTGWYSISIVNQTPSISGVNATYTLASDGTATTVTVTATDPEGIPLTYSIVSDTSGNVATVTQGTGANTNQWTITPSTNTANAGSFTLVFRANDGTNVASASSTFTLKFTVENSNYTTALITPTDNGYTSNKVFRDSSGNNHTITANGDATQNTFSPYRHGGYSTYFDGTGDYLKVTSTISAIGTDDFTVEGWFYLDSAGSGNVRHVWDFRPLNNDGSYPTLRVTTSNQYQYLAGGANRITSSAVTLNVWHHVAIVRYSSTTTLYIDGSSAGTWADTTSYDVGSTRPLIGGSGYHQSTLGFHGYIADWRFVDNTAVYTSAFTPPTDRLTAVTNTELLTCHLPYIADGSTNSHTITVNGDVKTEPLGPYDYKEYSDSDHGGSAYFDGNGDYLSIADSEDFNMGTGDYTIEYWYRHVSTVGNYPSAVATQNWSGTEGLALRYDNTTTANKVAFFWRPTGDPWLTSTNTFPEKTWMHIALVRSSNTFKLYVNGKQEASGSSTSANDWSTGGSFRVGWGTWDGTNGYINADMSDLRVVKGTAVYSGEFTPPNGPLTATGGSYPSTTNVNTSITSGHTKLLLPFDDATIIDKSQVSKAVKLVGNTTISTTQTKYLSYSMYFDGTGDYIEVADALGEFTNYSNATLEMWVYPTTSSGSQNLIEKFTPASGPGWTLYTTSGTLNLQWYGGGTTNSSTAMTVNQWNHVAVVHHNGTRKIYINGTGGTGVTFTSTVSTNPLRIGVRGTNGNFFTGYMSDIRIQLGRAVYTGNFTPPTAALEG